jgi:hypothetical protein
MKLRRFLLICAACIIGISVGIGIVLADLHHLIQKWGAIDVAAISKHLDEGVQKGTGAAADLAGVVKQERADAADETREFKKDLANVHNVIVNFDCAVSGCPGTKHRPGIIGVLPTLQAAITGIREDVGGITKRADSALEAAKGTLDAGTTAIGTLNQRLADEHLASFMANMDKASAGFAQTSVHLAGATGDIETKVHQLTRPVSFAKNVGITILDIGSKIGSALAGFLKF